MKADLFVQGIYWATIQIPDNSLLDLLAKGMITEASEKAAALACELTDLDHIECSVSLHIRHHPGHAPAPCLEHPCQVAP